MASSDGGLLGPLDGGCRKKLQDVAEALTGGSRKTTSDEERERLANLTPAERMKGTSACEQPTTIEVLECNWTAVQTYLRCQLTVVSGMAGVVICGVSASEVMASARMLRVPVREWPEVIDAVQLLAGMVAKIENEKMAAKAQAKG